MRRDPGKNNIILIFSFRYRYRLLDNFSVNFYFYQNCVHTLYTQWPFKWLVDVELLYLLKPHNVIHDHEINIFTTTYVLYFFACTPQCIVIYNIFFPFSPSTLDVVRL